MLYVRLFRLRNDTWVVPYNPVHNPVTVTFSTHETSAIADLRNRPHLSKLPNFPQPGFVLSIHRTLQCIPHTFLTRTVYKPRLRKVRGVGGGLEGEEPHPKGGSSPSKVFLKYPNSPQSGRCFR